MNSDHLANLSRVKEELSKQRKLSGKFVGDMRLLHGNFLKLEQVNKTYETNMDMLRRDISKLKQKLGQMGDLADKRKESILVLAGELETRGAKKLEIGKLLPYGTEVNGVSLKSNNKDGLGTDRTRWVPLTLILLYFNYA